MQDDCLDVSNKPFYKLRKTLFQGALPLGPQKHMAHNYNYYGGAVITSIMVDTIHIQTVMH